MKVRFSSNVAGKLAFVFALATGLLLVILSGLPAQRGIADGNGSTRDAADSNPVIVSAADSKTTLATLNTLPDMDALGRYHFEYGTTQGWFAQPGESQPGLTIVVTTSASAWSGNYGLSIGVSGGVGNWWAAAGVDNSAPRMTPTGTLTAHLRLSGTSTVPWAQLYILGNDWKWFSSPTTTLQSGTWATLTWNLTDTTLLHPIRRFGVQFGGNAAGSLDDALYLDAIDWTLPVYTQPIYTGAYLSGTGTIDFPNELACFDNVGGKHAGVINIFADWQSIFPAGTVNTILAHKSIPVITWEPKVGPTSILTDIVAGNYDGYIDSWSRALSQTHSTILLRWGHEMNGCVPGNDPPCWYPWGGNPAAYKAAWRYVHDRMAITNSVRNVAWTWTPNAALGTLYADYAEYYPGDAYVDWVGVSGYNSGQMATWDPKPPCRTFDDIFGPTLDDMAARYPKPQMVAEFASACDNGCDKALWIAEAYDQALFYPRLQATVWFNVAKWEGEGAQRKWVDWRIGCSDCGVPSCPNCEVYARGLSNLRYSSTPPYPVPWIYLPLTMKNSS